jgi:hypothetical protein
MPDQGQIDEKIKQELRSLEGPYNEGDWQEFEPFINSLQPPSAFKLNGKAVLIIILFLVLGTTLYFAIPVFKRLQISEPSNNQEKLDARDTGSTDPDHKPDTVISTPPPAIPQAVTVDSAAIKHRADSIKAATEIKTDRSKIPTPVFPSYPKKKTQPVKKDSIKAPEPEPEEEDFLRKEVPIIAEPQGDPRIEDDPEASPKSEVRSPF